MYDIQRTEINLWLANNQPRDAVANSMNFLVLAKVHACDKYESLS